MQVEMEKRELLGIKAQPYVNLIFVCLVPKECGKWKGIFSTKDYATILKSIQVKKFFIP